MKKEYIFFDLDGTLTDSSAGITNAAAYALRHFGITVADSSTLLRFVGPPLRESFHDFYGFAPEKAWEAVQQYRIYYNDKGVFENRVYDGIPQLLEQLQKAGRKLVVATSKPVTAARVVIEYFGLESYFEGIYGAELDGRREKKAEVIEYALAHQNISDPAAVVMVGDRKHDVMGAAVFGIPCIGVLYGFGSRQELEEAGACRIAEDIDALAAILSEEL